MIEQLLFRKYAVSISTYENYGGKDTSKVLNKLLSYSGATISNSLFIKVPFSANPLSDSKTQNRVNRAMDKFYNDIYKQKPYLCQKIKHFIIFRFGIFPFVIKKEASIKVLYLNGKARYQSADMSKLLVLTLNEQEEKVINKIISAIADYIQIEPMQVAPVSILSFPGLESDSTNAGYFKAGRT